MKDDDFGMRILEERKRLKLSQEKFGKLGDVGRSSQVLYEKGERKPDIDYLTALNRNNVDAFYIMTGQRIDQTAQGELQVKQYSTVEDALNAVIDLQTELGVVFSGDQLKSLIGLAWTAQLNRTQLKECILAGYAFHGLTPPTKES